MDPVGWLVVQFPDGRIEQALYDRDHCIPRTRALWKALPPTHRERATWSTRLPNPGKVTGKPSQPEAAS